MTVQLTPDQVRVYSLQILLLLHSKSLSVSLIPPSPKSEFGSNIQQEPVTTVFGHLLALERLPDGCLAVIWASPEFGYYSQYFTY